MKSFRGKFDVLMEDILYRYQQGGFLVGDAVKIKKDALRNEKLKDISEQFKATLQDAMNSDLNLRVASIKTERANSSVGLVGGADAPMGFWVDVVVEYAPGLFRNPITVPVEVLELNNGDGINQPTVPDSLKRKDTSNIKGEKPAQKEILKGSPDTKVGDPNRNLPNKNTKLAFS